MKKLKSYLLIALSVCMLASCLDKYPQDEIPADSAITTIEEANQAVIGIYNAWLSGALYSGYLTLLPDLQADLAYAVNGYTNTYGDIWRWDILATNTQITSVYGALYDVIGRCNFLLHNVDKVRDNIYSDEDFDRLEQYQGEAYFARALAYSELIKLFCKAYDSDEMAAKELGVVLRKEYYSTDSLTRASLKDSYAFVIEDLKRAEDYLQLTEEEENDASLTFYSSPYFSIYTVYALRARVALYMKDYDNAIKYSTLLIDAKDRFALSSASTPYTTMTDYLSMQSGKQISYYEYMWRYNLSTESIWQVGFTTTSYGGALGSVFFNWDYQSYKPDYVPAQWVLELYGANDMRYNANFCSVTTGHSHGLTWPLLAKYWGNQELFEGAQLLHVLEPQVFRLSEQYLIRAEAYVGQKNYSKASNDIAELRKARYSSGASASLTEKNAMEVIEEERVKELYMEGFRLQDLKRWHKGFERKPQEQSLANGSSLKVEADNPLFVWPIPQHELESPGADIEPNESNK
ncbi:MAG: RagB/SusD family nutrient uptake outer membrane protein [Bacteroidaceae bacterium]|nr:RagB/SusD family nutrient uptake outer membrane protein [Bacteroidaceae bacterium]